MCLLQQKRYPHNDTNRGHRFKRRRTFECWSQVGEIWWIDRQQATETEMLGGAVAAQFQAPTTCLYSCTPVLQAVTDGISRASQCFPHIGERSQTRETAFVVLRTRTGTGSAVGGGGNGVHVVCARKLRPVVERFKIHHEKNVSEERLKALGVSRWSKWDCGPCVTTYRKWLVDELVYVAKGSVEVMPEGCNDGAYFYAGDLVKFPKWFEASLTFEEDYEQRYKFFAYGDDPVLENQVSMEST